MLKLFIFLCFVNYAYSMDVYKKTNLSQVKVLVLQNDSVNIYLKNSLYDEFDMCKVNNLFNNNYLVNNNDLKIVCKKHFLDYMLCEKDLILLTLKTNYEKCDLEFATYDNILQLFIKETINLSKNYIYQQTLYNCLRFFGLFLAVKFVIYIISHDNFDFTNNIYTR
jgi:hypothetical protein